VTLRGPISAIALPLLISCAKTPAFADGGASSSGGPAAGASVRISLARRTERAGTWGLNYWMWAPTYGDNVTGTENQVEGLAPRFLRVGGHNNDNNSPDPFDGAQLDRAVSYARAVGAELILQAPLLADERGAAPTAATAAAMVTDANVTKGYGIKYFSLGNEPDLYAVQEPTRPNFSAHDYCVSARAFTLAMKAVDPTIQIVGPDLSWMYQPGNDWLTPILTECGDRFDVVSIHRYPFAPADSFAASAAVDASNFQSVIEHVRGILRTTGQGDKPLAITETNVTYDGSPEKSTLDASPGTVPAALWAADMLGTSLGEGLWTTLFWSISEGWTLGLITPPPHAERPAYHALRLFAEHFGPTLVDVTETTNGVRAFASRAAGDTITSIIVVNWNQIDENTTFDITGTAAPLRPVTFTLRARTVSAVEIPDDGPPAAWSYGELEHIAQTGPQPISADPPP
jgi:hypothetical protein